MALTFAVPTLSTLSVGIIRAEPMTAPRVRRGASSRSDSPAFAAPAGARLSDTPSPHDPFRGALARPAGGGGRRQARGLGGALARAAAGAVLAALLALPVPAQAQTEVWSGTLTAGAHASFRGCDNSNNLPDCSTASVLSDDDFTHDGTTYQITALAWNTSSTNLGIQLDTAMTDATKTLTLVADGTTYAFEDAGTKIAAARVWSVPGLGWADGDSVSLSLTEPAQSRDITRLQAPTITGIAVSDSPSMGNNAYGIDTTVEFEVTFSEVVLVDNTGGNASFTVRVGDTDRTATGVDVGGNATTTPKTVLQGFAVSVQEGDEDTDGVSIAAGSLALNGSTIQSASMVDATLTHGAFSFPDKKMDGVIPTFDSAAIDTATDNTALVLTFSEALNTFRMADIAASDFSVSVGGTANTVTAFAIDGSTVTLTLTDAVAATATNVTVSYTAQSGSLNQLRDFAGNDVGSFTNETVDVTSGTTQTVPLAPTGLGATAGDAQVALSWTAGGDGGSAITKHQYRQKAGGGSYGSWTDIATSAAGETNATSYTVTGLTNGTAYTFQVRAVNTVGDGAASGEASATPMAAATAPLAPTGLSAMAGDTQVALSWTAGGNGGSAITKHQYRQKAGGGSYGSWTDIATSAAGETNATSYTVTGLTNGTAYTFQVRAVNAVGDGAASGEASATPMAAATAPLAPTGLSATAGNTQMALSWTAGGDGGSAITKHQYRQKAGGGSYGSWTDIATSAAGQTNATSYTVTGLTNGTAYTFQVRAVNAVGDGAASGEASATPMAPGVTVSPTAVSATEGGATGSYTVVLKTQPSGTVTVTVGDTSADISASPSTLTFTTSTWDTAQTVTVSADDDSVAESEEQATLTHSVTSTDSDYNGLSVDSVTVTITDNDTTEPIFDPGPYAPTITSPTCGSSITIDDGMGGYNEVAISLSWGATVTPTGIYWFTEDHDRNEVEGRQTDTATLTVTPNSTWLEDDSRIEITIVGETATAKYPRGTGPGTKVVFTPEDGSTDSAECGTQAPVSGLSEPSATDGARYVIGDRDSTIFIKRAGEGDETAPELSGAAVNGATLTLAFGEALDEGSAPPAGAFAVAVDGAARGVDTVALAGGTATLTLAAPVTAGETVTVDYTPPAGTGATPLRDAAGNAVAGFTGHAVTNETPAAVNTPPTGLPAISGTARVGETLTAAVDGIGDADGLAGVTFAYQWLSDDGTAETEIAGATEASYTLTGAEAGRSVRVRVTFVDGGGTEETLESAPTAAVKAALTARLENIPTSHDGSSAFTFELHFSEEFALSYRTLRDAAFEVTGGTVKRARRLVQGSNQGWRIRVRPTTDGDVTVVLPAGRACGETGAVCADDGRRLSNALALTVPGPASPGNRAPTGLPIVSGTARVGETLTAAVDGIADADGLAGVFAYQWESSDGTTETEIAGATQASHTLSAAEEDRTVRVRVTFTDNGGTEETLLSAPTAAVAPMATLPEVSVAADGAEVEEGTAAAFTLTRTGSTAAALTVAVRVTETGTFLDGAAPSGAEFGAGEATATLSVATDDDQVLEDDGSVTVEVTAGQGYTVGTPARATAAVVDDEVPVDLVVTVESPVAESAGAVTVTVTATTAEDRPPSGAFMFTMATADGTATEGTDYERLFESQTSLPTDFTRRQDGSAFRYVRSYEFTTGILDDAAAEGDETFAISLYTLAPGLLPPWVTVNGTPFDGTSRVFEVTIADDDGAPEITTASPVLVAENATAVATLEATDADTAVEDLEWSLAGGAEMGAFSLTAEGVLAFQAAKDFEAPDDADGDGDYEVTVSVSDGANTVEAALTVRLTDVDDTAPGLTEATVNGSALTLAFDEPLDGGSVPPSGAFAVAVDDAARAVDTVELAGGAATLTLASPVAAGTTVTAGYTPPSGAGATPLRDAAGNAVAGFSGRAVTNEAVNAEPTGLPTIAGTVQVGETLTASVDGIEDADGLAGVTFSYQWVSNDGTTETDIQDAAEATYTLAAADAGKTVKVRVTFTDGGGTEESVESEATAPVAALPVEVSMAADSSPVTEGVDATFTLTRSGDASAALTVAVTVSQAGSVLSGSPPTAVTFEAQASEAKLRVPTLDDGTAEADARVTASVAASAGYVVAASAGTAGVDVLDNDAAPVAPAEVTVWSADMAVADLGTDGGYGAGSADGFSNAAGSAAVTMRWLWYWAPDRTLYMAVAQRLADSRELTLHLGDVAVALAEGGDGSSFSWWGVDLDWAGGETVAVRLTKPGAAEPVPAGASVSVGDAQVREAAGAALAFRVTLDAAQPTAVSVRYATSNGTAAAGSDYVAASGAVRFAPGVTERTVAVRVLEDAHDEGAETMTLTLSAPFGAELADAQATGTIVNTDPMPKAWLARFGRTVATQVVDAVASRLEADGGSHVTLGGERIDSSGLAPGGAALRDAEARQGLEALSDWFRGAERQDGARGRETRTMSERELLLGSAFHLASESEPGGASYTAWGRVAAGRFDADEDGVRMDGEVTTGIVGADVARGRWLAGAAVAHSRGEGTFGLEGDAANDSAFGGGTVESTLTGVYPYGRLELNERVTAWGLAGYGTGRLTLANEGEAPIETDIAMTMGALGGRATLVPAPETGGFELALKSDALWMRMTSDRAEGMEGAEADVSRLRLLLDASRSLELDEGTLTPSLELGLRLDGGDAETGTGVEAGAGLRYAGTGVTIEGSVRGLVAHEASGYEEWGASGSVRIDPGASGRGLTLTLSPSWGNASSGTERLWSAADADGLAPDTGFEAGSRLEAELGYGLGGPRGLGVATPWAGLGLANEGERTWRAGVRWKLGPDASLGLEGARREAANDDAPEHGLMLRGSLRW